MYNENEEMEFMQEEETQETPVESTELAVNDTTPRYPESVPEVSDESASSGLSTGQIVGIGAAVAGAIYVGKRWGVPAVKAVVGWFGQRKDDKLRKQVAKRGWTLCEKVEEPASAPASAESAVDVPTEEVKPAEENVDEK